MSVSGITAAALLRIIEAHGPTVLIDEFDTLSKGEREMAEALRGLLNAGFDRASARMIRNVPGAGGAYEPREFSAWAPVVVSGIGNMPDTVRDRSIIVRLRRKLPRETVERLRTRDGGELKDLARMVARWTGDHMAGLRFARPSMPDGLHDRAADAWEPLIAIADAAGDNWSRRAQDAALALTSMDDESDYGTMLLADMQTVFLRLGAEALSSEDVVTKLCEMVDRPWAEIAHGRPMTPNRLARMLKPYEVRPEQFWDNDGRQRRGYQLLRLAPVWERYLTASAGAGARATSDGQD